LIVPPHPFGCGPHDGPPEQATGTHPAVTVSGCTSGACPAAPELAEISTTVVWGTELAAWMDSATWASVQLPSTKGCPFAMMEATEGLLLPSVIWTPLAGALLAKLTRAKPIPPAAIEVGSRV